MDRSDYWLLTKVISASILIFVIILLLCGAVQTFACRGQAFPRKEEIAEIDGCKAYRVKATCGADWAYFSTCNNKAKWKRCRSSGKTRRCWWEESETR